MFHSCLAVGNSCFRGTKVVVLVCVVAFSLHPKFFEAALNKVFFLIFTLSTSNNAGSGSIQDSGEKFHVPCLV